MSDIGRGLTPEATQQLIKEQNQHLLDDPFASGNIPGVDDSMTVEGGVDPTKDDDNCTGGACKL